MGLRFKNFIKQKINIKILKIKFFKIVSKIIFELQKKNLPKKIKNKIPKDKFQKKKL